MASHEENPILVQHLFRPLDQALVALLKSLDAKDWEKLTVAGTWTVKNVATHLLDGNLRALSMQRDQYFGERAPKEANYRQMVDWLNQLNAAWVQATHRLSPSVLIMMLEVSGNDVCSYYESLDLWDEAIFPVGWAGESKSYNWMHIAREYTEKWHHQQQIRDATGKPGIMNRLYFEPLISTYLRGLPNLLKAVEAKVGTVLRITIRGEIGGEWFLMKSTSSWEFIENPQSNAESHVSIPADVAWKLFSHNLKPNQAIRHTRITGDQALGQKVLDLVAVMA